jgi:hypothetical protein
MANLILDEVLEPGSALPIAFSGLRGFEDDPAIRVPRRIVEGGRDLVRPF